MKTSKDQLVIRAGEQTYPVVVTSYRRRLAGMIEKGSTVAVVSNPTVFALHGAGFIKDCLPPGRTVIPLMMGDGERYKSRRTVNNLYEYLLDIGAGRRDTLVAFGGGVVGDTAGFVAATFKRGMNFIQVPTTLVAMVDASIGGKVGINHRAGKNLIGAFYQPRAVILNPDWLGTLGTREMVEGLAEIIKTGFLSSRRLLETAAATPPEFDGASRDTIRKLIRQAIRFKAGIVAADVHDRGRRAVLNFGHTFAHAIEAAERFRRYRHGEAVLAGMAAALRLSHSRGRLSHRRMTECLGYLAPLTRYLRPLKKNTDDYVSPITVDKKGRGGKAVFVLLDAIGRPAVRPVTSHAMIADAIDFMKDFVNNQGKM